MNYSLDAGCWNSVMAVPACVVDQYIKLASGDALKLILYLLRHGSASYSDEQLCERLGIASAGELEDAAQFWIQRGLIKCDSRRTNEESTVAVPARQQKKEQSEQLTLSDYSQTQSSAETAVSAKKVGTDRGLYYTSGDVAARIKDDPDIEFLFKEAEQLYGHALKGKEVQTVMSLADTYELPAEVAILLLGYCFKIGKTTPAYIMKTAKDWADENIDTLELANAKLLKLEKQNSVEEMLRREMEFQSKWTAKQLKYIRTWTQEWGFGMDMIMLAYEITVNRTGKASFDYANTILDNWSKEGIGTPEQVQQKDIARKNAAKTAKPEANTESSFDIDDVLAQIKNKYKNPQG